MDIHNINEDVVFETVQTIFDEIQKNGNQENFCLCYQCRMDTVCYALNRVEPHYIISNRGLTRVEINSINHQQVEADITTLVYKGLRLVNHNLRPTAPHDDSKPAAHPKFNHPLYDIPTIAGRLFDGVSFEPIVDIDLALYCEGELVPMRNSNWQNPFTMISSTPGAFSFWPAPVEAQSPDVSHDFKFSLRVTAPNYEPFNHFFNITAVSKFHTPHSYTMNRTFKLPDLYLFPPGNDEEE